MKDCLDQFQKILEDYGSNKQLLNHVLELVELLHQDLKNERSTTAVLQHQIRELTEKENFGITSKFVNLKVAYADLQEKLISLKNENDDLNIQLIGKDEELKRLITENENKIKYYYENQLKQKDVILKEKEKEVEVLQETYKQKEQKLYDEIQAGEAASAIMLDKLETDHRKQLTEANKRIKESMDTCNVLRNELLSVKEQLVEYKRNSNQKISDLQSRLREMTSPGGTRRELETFDSNTEETNTLSKYQPLDINYRSLPVLEDKPINLKKTPIYRGSNKTYNYHTKNTLPPLVNLTEKPAQKRRRLFNPDDLSYLEVTEREGNNY